MFLAKLLRNIRPWGFKNLSIYDVASFFWTGLMEGSITTRASSIAFNFFLAFFPAIIFLFTLIPYIPINNFQTTLMDILYSVLPPSTNEAATNTVSDIINNPRGGLLSIGFLLALYFSTSGVSSLIEAFNSSYHIKESRSFLYQKYISLILTLILSAMLFLTITIIIFGQTYLNMFIEKYNIIGDYRYLFPLIKWIFMSLFLFLGTSIVFNIAPNLKQRWRFISPGTMFSTVFIIIGSIIFSYYINNFSQYNQIYGSISTLMIILLWMYFNSIILITGLELNASIVNAAKNKEELI